MEILIAIFLMSIIFYVFSRIQKAEAEIKRLWDYGVHMESILRKNNLWDDNQKN
jgi:hypothetical protein